MTAEKIEEPLWVAFPDMHPISIGWRMGAGEGYAMEFWTWWGSAQVSRTEASRLAYVRKWPMPPTWTHVAIEMIWPDFIEADSMVFFDPDMADERRALFEKAISVGLPDEAAWEADLNDPKWRP